jgi:thiol-disulfide isomerase/thioredoxin
MLAACLFCPSARCEVQSGQSGKYSPQINIKKTADGLVVNVSHNQEVLEDIHFGCDQENNRIIVDLPVENERGIMKTLQENPNVVRNGVSSESLPSQEMKRIRILPRLKLSCTGVKMISKFQRYITYLYPAGRDLKLTAAHVTGFDFDGDNPRTQVNGSIRLTFNEPLGDVDLADAVSVTDTVVTLKLNPRDFVNQEMVSSLFPVSNLDVRSSSADSSGLHAFDFRSIGAADIGKVRAKLVRSPDSNELRLDVTLTVSLYATGRKLYESGNSRKALVYLEAAKRDPAFAQVARMSMGTVFWNEDNYAEAVKNFRELIELDRSWEFPEARYYALKSYYLLNKTLSFELTALLKEYLRRCDRMKYQTCADARELSEQVNEPALKVYQASKVELKKLVAKLADPRFNYNEVQKNIFHYWATWCPVCLEEMPRIMQYAVAHPNVSIYIVAKYDSQKNILSTLLKSGAIRRKNIFYYIDTRDDIMLRQMVPLVLANKEPVTPLPISVFLQRDVPFYLTDKLNWNEAELSPIWQLKYRE